MTRIKCPKATIAGSSSAPNQSLCAYSSTLTSANVEEIIEKHGLVREHIRVPTREERGHCPPEGYDAWSVFHCEAGAIPPLSTYYANFVNFIGATPFQLSPNTYYILAALRVLFETEFGREPSHNEIMFLYELKNSRTTPAFYFLRARHGFKPIEELRSNAGDYQRKYFFLQEDNRFPHLFQVARKIERPKEDENLKAMVKRLRELSKDERCATYLVTDQLLHGCNLIGDHQSVGVKRKTVGKKSAVSRKVVAESSEGKGLDYSSSEASVDEIMGVIQNDDMFLDEDLDLFQHDVVLKDEANQSPCGESNMNTFKSIRRNTRQLEQEKREEYEANKVQLAEAGRKKDDDLFLDERLDLFQDDGIPGDEDNRSPHGESNMNIFKSIRRNTRQLEQEKRKEYEAEKRRLAEADRKKDEEARRKVDRDRGSNSEYDASKDASKRDRSCDNSSDQQASKRLQNDNRFSKPQMKGAQTIPKPSTLKETVSKNRSPQLSPFQNAAQQSPIPKAPEIHSSSSHKTVSSASDQVLEIPQLVLPPIAGEVMSRVDKLCQEYAKAKNEAEIYKASEAVLKRELNLFRTKYEANKMELEGRIKDIEKLKLENTMFEQSIFDICTQSTKIGEAHHILKGEKAKWAEEKASLMEERAKWVKERDKLTEEKNELVEEKVKLAEEKNTLRAENAGFKKEIAEMNDEFDNMMYYFWDANENGNFGFLREDKERIINECKKRRARELAAEKMSPIILKTEVVE